MKCPVPNCGRDIRAPQLMCKGHWFKLSASVRSRIWHLYRTAPETSEHRDACLDAVRYVHELERAQGTLPGVRR